MRTSNKAALSVAGLALVGIGGSVAWAQMKRMPQMMQMCTRMCSEMLNAIRQTTAMASFPTPELQQSFSAWLKGIEDEAQASITEGAKDAASLAAVLEIDEASARHIMGRLSADGKATLTAQART